MMDLPPNTPEVGPHNGVPSFDARGWAEFTRLELAYSNLHAALAAAAGSGAILVYLLHDICPMGELTLWLVVLYAVTAVRFRDQRLFLRLSRSGLSESLDTAAWRRRFALGVGASGIVWGLAGAWLFPSGSLPHQLFIAFMLAGLSAGSVTAYSVVRGVYFAWALPVIVPLGARFALEGTDVHRSMAGLTALYLAFVIYSSINTTRVIDSALSARSENHELAAALLKATARRLRDDVPVRPS